MRWEFYEEWKDPWWEQCVEYSSKTKISKDFMLMLGLNEVIDQLTMGNSVHLYGHVLRRWSCHEKGFRF